MSPLQPSSAAHAATATQALFRAMASVDIFPSSIDYAAGDGAAI
jgi:hypothetical protein